MKPHKFVQHPNELLKACKKETSFIKEHIYYFQDYVGENILPKHLHFLVSFFVPLLIMPFVIFYPSSDEVKIITLFLALFAQSWIQWWALPALQRLQVKADEKREAKADVDHIAMTHIANQVDANIEDIKDLHKKLDEILDKLNG